MNLDLVSGIFKVSFINLLLSGDNAVVISLACRNLSPGHRRLGMIWGASGAVVARVILTLFAAKLIVIPSLELIGGVLLIWIGIKLLLPEREGDDGVKAHDHLWGAIRTIILADVVMSLDNVLGVVGAARGNWMLIILGLILSIPIIVFASELTMRLMERFPVIVMAGAGLIGFVAGEMLVDDHLVSGYFGKTLHVAEISAGILTALFIVVAGTWLQRRKFKERA